MLSHNIFVAGHFNPSFLGDLQMRTTHLGRRPPSFMDPFHELRSLFRGAKCRGVPERWLVLLSHHRQSGPGRGAVNMAD